jgi:SAM-dependent methyltransferase
MKGLANDYRLWRFGSRREIRIPGGRLAGRLVPSRSQNIDLEMRYLPKPSPESRNLLDVGCGNGAFLALAAEAGWRSFGVEPDEKAAKLASDRGLEVRTRLEDWASSGITFDAMTFNHTVEHMHDPVAMLQLASSMLRPGGFLYIETPNMLAGGHDIYQRHWRGLETPRHLVLFSDQALQTTLAECGFSAIRVPDRPSPLLPMAEMSRRQAAGLYPYSDEALPASAPPSPTSRDIADERNIVTRREFLTVTAHKDPVP